MVTECGDGVHDKKDCAWGNFLAVAFDNQPFQNMASRGGGRGDSSRGGRAGFGGRGHGWMPGSSNEQEQMDMELGSVGRGANPNARRRLVAPDGTMLNNHENQVAPGLVANKVYLLEGSSSGGMDKVVTTPQKYQDLKRQRKDGDGNQSLENNVISATSFEEDRREQ